MKKKNWKMDKKLFGWIKIKLKGNWKEIEK